MYRSIVYKSEKNNKKATKTLKKFLKNNYSYKIYKELANSYFQAGNSGAGLAIYKKLKRQFPEEADFSFTLGQLYSSIQSYESAVGYYEECLKIAPYASGYLEKLAECYEEMEETDKAIEYYNKVIEYGRYDFDAREKVRVLNGEDKLFEQFAEVKEPEDIFEKSPIARDLPEDNSVMLLDQTHKIVHEDGATESRRYIMVKVFNASGVDSWKEYNIPTGNGRLVVEEAKVYKADGGKLDAEVNYNYIVFTDLEEGDAIYIQYKKESTNYGKLAKHFWSQHYFDYFIPSLTNNYSLLVHKSKKFKYEVTNGKIDPKTVDKGDYKLYEWKTKDNKGIKSESYMPSLVDVTPTLHLSSFENWNEVVNWYVDLSQTKQKADVELKNTVDELFKGKENLSEMEKAKLIYDYITKNIRYSSISFRQSGLIPQKASKVISTKLGDCKDVSTLFVTMCREVGLDANLVLVNTRDNGDKDVYLPSIDFNHCIAKVNLNNKPYYIELTSDLIPFSTQGINLRYATVLDISKGNNDIQHLDVDTRLKNDIRRETTLSFDGDDMTVKKKTVKSGDYSGDVRATYRDIGKEKQRKNMQESINDMYVKTKLTELTFDETLDSNVESVTFNYEYLVEDVFNDVGGILIFKLPWSDKAVQEDFISDEKRKLPISLWRYSMADVESEKITVNLPKGKKLVKAKPDDIIIDNKFFSYSLTHKKSGNQLIITRKFNFKEYTIPPSDYEKFKEAYEKVIKADTRQLAFNA
ncbi:MAG: transglutaminase domain-containing protein [Flavobacteriales bacterium]